MFRRRRFGLALGLVLIAGLVFSYSLTLAQDKEDPAPAKASSDDSTFRQKLNTLVEEEKPGEMVKHEIDTFVRYMPKGAVKAMTGHLGLIQNENEYSAEFKAFGKVPIEFGIGTEYVSLDNTTGVNLPLYLTGMSAGVDLTLPFFNFNKTYIRLGVTPSFYSNTWAFRTSSFRIPSRIIIIRQPSDKLTYVFGVAVFPSYRTGQILPVFGFIYKPNDKLLFNIMPDRPTVNYMLNDKISVFAEFDANGSEYQIYKDDIRKMILRYSDMRAGAGLSYQINKVIETSLSVGGAFNRTFRYDTDSYGKVKMKDGLYTELRVQAEF